MNKKYIIDTDIGDDVDDAFAVMLAAKSEMDLLGITTVFRNSKQRAQMAQYLLRLIGHEEIPVYAGVDKPFLQKIEYSQQSHIQKDIIYSIKHTKITLIGIKATTIKQTKNKFKK